MMTIYKLIEANLYSVWYFYELLPEILLEMIAAGIFAYNLGKDAGRKKAEEGFLKEFAEMFTEAASDMEELIENLADVEDNDK